MMFYFVLFPDGLWTLPLGAFDRAATTSEQRLGDAGF